MPARQLLPPAQTPIVRGFSVLCPGNGLLFDYHFSTVVSKADFCYVLTTFDGTHLRIFADLRNKMCFDVIRGSVQNSA